MLLMTCLAAVKALNGARAGQRRNIKFGDIEHAARGDRRFVEMGLYEAMSQEQIFSDARGEAAGKTKQSAGATQTKAGSKENDSKQMRSISSFFA